MQMQLSDRQSSHAQASSNSVRSSTRPVTFKKAYSPDIPEPPHKKGSGQSSSLEVQKQPVHQLRRKLPEGSVRNPKPYNSISVLGSAGLAGGPEANGSHTTNGTSQDEDHSGREDSPSPPSVSSDSEADEPNPGRTLASSSVFGMNGHRQSKQIAQKRTQDTETSSQLHLARLLGNRGNVEGAHRLAEQLHEADHTDPDILCLRGQCFAALDKRAQVILASLLTRVCWTVGDDRSCNSSLCLLRACRNCIHSIANERLEGVCSLGS